VHGRGRRHSGRLHGRELLHALCPSGAKQADQKQATSCPLKTRHRPTKHPHVISEPHMRVWLSSPRALGDGRPSAPRTRRRHRHTRKWRKSTLQAPQDALDTSVYEACAPLTSVLPLQLLRNAPQNSNSAEAEVTRHQPPVVLWSQLQWILCCPSNAPVVWYCPWQGVPWQCCPGSRPRQHHLVPGVVVLPQQ